MYVHPRSPYTRVDALRSTRPVRIEIEGVVLATSTSPVMVFETGLPTRYYLNPTDVDFSRLLPSDTVTECPYKGTTSGYWSAEIGNEVRPDIAWTYAFPTRQVQPIAGLIAFYNEKVDTYLDGDLLERPDTHFSPEARRPLRVHCPSRPIRRSAILDVAGPGSELAPSDRRRTRRGSRRSRVLITRRGFRRPAHSQCAPESERCLSPR